MIEIGDQKAYNVQEAAQMLQITAQTVRAYIKDGKLKAQKVGHGYHITEENLQIFLRG